MPRDCLLVCNAGSATLKVKIFRLADLSLLVEGVVERVGLPGSLLELQEITSGRMIRRNFPAGIHRHGEAFGALAGHLPHWAARLRAVAHRIVHGGTRFRRPTRLTGETVRRLNELAPLAPLHTPVNLEVAARAASLYPDAPGIGVFDTAYYAALPPEVVTYAIPHELAERFHIRRYGFHGLSHQYLAHAAAEKLRRPLSRLRVITCHLGSGCSITATKFGSAVDTSMGFTPLSGVIMGTRSGDLDPAVVTCLQRNLALSADGVDDLLNTKSGLRGLFGVSGDLRDVLVAAGHAVGGSARATFTAAERRRARVALAAFSYSIARYINAYAGLMGGLDGLVFSGAIGVRSPVVRTLIRRRLPVWRRVNTLVIATDEELMIARLAQRMARRHRAARVAAHPAAPPGLAPASGDRPTAPSSGQPHHPPRLIPSA